MLTNWTFLTSWKARLMYWKDTKIKLDAYWIRLIKLIVSNLCEVNLFVFNAPLWYSRSAANHVPSFTVYGALLWSLGKTMTSPEVARVYVGSFWDEPLKSQDNAELFEQEEKDLMKDLAILPRQSAMRKINEVSGLLLFEKWSSWLVLSSLLTLWSINFCYSW